MQQAYSPSRYRIGILGGGQLGKMLLEAASRWDLHIHVLDPDPACPASGLTRNLSVGSFRDYDEVLRFGEKMDYLTIEIEDVNTDALKVLEKKGVLIHPSPAAIERIRDKGLQKQFLSSHEIPTAGFRLFDDRNAIEAALASGEIHFPFVQKLRTGGYDGRGVQVIRSRAEMQKCMDGPSLLEDLIEVKKELAVICARNARGELSCYPAVEMVFDPHANLLEYLLAPARIEEDKLREAEVLARKCIKAFDISGLLAVELFLDEEDRLWVNEVAPRPHNSGHHTIESAWTSQFEQHLRAILNWPLGPAGLHHSAAMINLLGSEGAEGEAQVEGFEEALGMERVFVHLYGKKKTRPFRKMGHVTLIDDSGQRAVEKVKYIRNLLKIRS